MTSLARMSVGLGATAAIGVLSAAPLGIGAETPARTIDRTLVCPMSGAGYPDPARFMSVGADPFLPASDASPSIYVYNGPGDATGVSAGIRTGRGGSGHPSITTGALGLTPTLCARTKLAVSLASSARKARPTGPFGELHRCEVPAKVLIRVRAVFKRPARLVRTRSSSLFEAKGNIAAASLAVTTLRGKLIFFATVNDASGKARIFVPRSGCSRGR